MKKKQTGLCKWMTAFLFLLFSCTAFSQAKKVSGRIVSDTDSLPLRGATVQVQGSSIIATTDVNGNFSIDVPSEQSVLVFSYAGMETQEIPVGSSSVID